jgi:hypothetical protein
LFGLHPADLWFRRIPNVFLVCAQIGQEFLASGGGDPRFRQRGRMGSNVAFTGIVGQRRFRFGQDLVKGIGRDGQRAQGHFIRCGLDESREQVVWDRALVAEVVTAPAG